MALNNPSKALSLCVSVICGVLIWLQLDKNMRVDGTTVALIGIGLLPWMFQYIDTFKAGPGGIEIKRLVESVQQNNTLLQATQTTVSEAKAAAEQAATIAQVTQVVATTGVGKTSSRASAVPVGAAARPRTRGLGDEESMGGEVDLATTDPLASQFGNDNVAQGRRLSASVTTLPWNPELFELQLTVSSLAGQPPLKDGERVIFHLHPTFSPAVVAAAASNGAARLVRYTWGAFTVGVEIPGEGTRLGLDLARLDAAPPLFRAR